jgi:aminomethyltransferase
MKSIALEKLHAELGAKFGAFGGFNMPIQYPAGLKAEHLHTRTRAGLFDVSHMGQLRITAPDDPRGTKLAQSLEAALPCDFDGWPRNVQRYSVLLNDRGGIEDDLMLVWRESEVRMVVNAGNRDTDLARLSALAPSLKFEWIDAALIALQGPESEVVLSSLDPSAAAMTFMQATELNLLGATCFTTRSGYTGEDGYEISIPKQDAERVVRALLSDSRVKPVGLGARDTLRLEAGLPLHGNDISQTINPIEAQLAFAIAPSRRLPKMNSDGSQTAPAKTGGFPGSNTVLSQLAEGASRKLVGMISRESVPIRSRAKIVDARGQVVGEVTSGTISPSLGIPVMLALVETRALSGPLSALVRDKTLAVEITKVPFVPKRYKR